jgi:hypothetical protein
MDLHLDQKVAVVTGDGHRLGAVGAHEPAYYRACNFAWQTETRKFCNKSFDRLIPPIPLAYGHGRPFFRILLRRSNFFPRRIIASDARGRTCWSNEAAGFFTLTEHDWPDRFAVDFYFDVPRPVSAESDHARAVRLSPSAENLASGC